MINGANRFIVLEGICCSGKTTFSNRLISVLKKNNFNTLYNHGAMTYTELGREFYNTTSKMDTSISAVYYFVDLIINTNKILEPALNDSNTIIVQDRYFDSITTYTSAYGKYYNHNLDIYRISDVLIENEYLINPFIRVFCVPPFNVIVERMKNSKNTKVHDFYKRNPDFLQYVYNELLYRANTVANAFIVDTNSELSIVNAIESILNMILK